MVTTLGFLQYVLVGTSQYLTIPFVTFADEGDYKCIAFNAAGNAQSSVVTLTVYPPWFEFCPQCFREVYLPRGCTVYGLPYYHEAICDRRKCRPRHYVDPADICTAPQRRFECQKTGTKTLQVNIDIGSHLSLDD